MKVTSVVGVTPVGIGKYIVAKFVAMFVPVGFATLKAPEAPRLALIEPRPVMSKSAVLP